MRHPRTARAWLGLTAVVPALPLLIQSLPCTAQTYTWTDEHGGIHFSDAPPLHGNARKASLPAQDATGPESRRASVSTAIPTYRGPHPSRTVRLLRITLDLPQPHAKHFEVGQTLTGEACQNAKPLYVPRDAAAPIAGDVGTHIREQLEAAGYAIPPEASDGPSELASDLALIGSIVELQQRICRPTGVRRSPRRGGDLRIQNFRSPYSALDGQADTTPSTTTRVSVEWTVFDLSSRRQVYQTRTSAEHASAKSLSAAWSRSGLEAALKGAASQLLERAQILGLLSPAQQIVPEARQAAVTIRRTSRPPADLRAAFKDITQAAARIETARGAASGFLISNDGYVLTLAESVRGLSRVEVRLRGASVAARVIRIDELRGVALLQIQDEVAAAPMFVSSAQARMGESIYALSLSSDFAPRAAPGIVSARRTIQGIPLLQSDVSVSESDYGGAIINESGEVIGMTIGGLVARSGADYSINYFLPIDEVLGALGIEVEDSGRWP